MSLSVGFIGAGQMAQALAKGIATGNPGTKFFVGDPSDSAVEQFASQLNGCEYQRLNDNDDVGVDADVLFLAVKPQYLREACSSLAKTASTNPLTISIATGITLESLQEITGIDRLIRVMPNTPALIGQGVCSISPGAGVTPKDVELAERLLGGIGLVRQIPESLIDAVVGVSGSGPAYVYGFIEALSDGGVLMGLPREMAMKFAVQTVLGAAELVKRSGEHPAVLRDRVASPGGTTIAAMEALERNGFHHAIMSAVRAAAEKSKALGEE